jgi:hypothetical protein
MLRSYWLLAGIAAAALGAWVAPGCGSNTESNPGTGGTGSTTTTTGSTSSSTGGSVMSAEPPGPPPTMMPDGTGNTTFAISELFLGDTDRNGMSDPINGWKQYGFNIDGIIATPPYTNLCKPVDNAPASVHANGNGGIDNSFGANILPIILGISSDASQKINQSITEGKFTIMLSMVNLGTSANYNPLLTRLYGGSQLTEACGDGGMCPTTPKFDGTDVWPVLQELLNDPTDITSAKVQFMASYVNNNTWVSGSKGDVNLMLTVDSFSLNLTIGSAQIAFDMDSTHHHGTNGTIAGVLNTQTLINELKSVAGAFDPAFCDPNNTTFASIATQIAQASDILSDGTQDPTKQCDGISIGLGFNSELVQLGGIAPPAATTSNPCGDAGAGGGG